MRSSGRLLLSCVAQVPLFVLAAWLAYWPPWPSRTHDAPAKASGARAWGLIERVFEGSAPHEVGSKESALVRERLLREMRAMRLAPVEQRGLACAPWGGCADVVNVLARIEGERDGALLLMAHYDSVPTGPGIGDDASGTAAVLETTRALLARGTPAYDVIVLITDGEELGLLGARLFVGEHPWADDVRWVINAEARGTTGPQLMFETSLDNAALVRTVARGNRGLITNSLLYTVYRKLPNDTDLTVLRETGAQAINFAMIGGAHRYHTRLDDLQHLDPRSLDHATRMVHATATRILDDAPSRSAGDSVFFDVFGRIVVQWPAAWSMLLGLATAIVFLLAAVITLRRRGLVREFFAASGRSGLSVGIAALSLFGVSALLRSLGAMRAAWPAEPLWMFLAFASVVVLLLATAHVLTRQFDRYPLWAAIWIPVVVAAPVVAWLVPGASFIVWLPALAAAIGALTELRRNEGIGWVAVTLPYGVSLFVMVSLLWQLYLAMGTSMVPVIAGLCFLTLLGTVAAVPVGAGRRMAKAIAIAAFVLFCVATVVAVSVPEWSEDSPQPVTLQMVNVDGRAQWALPPSAPSAMLDAAAFGDSPVPLLPFDEVPSHLVAAADAADLPLPGVSVTQESVGEGVVARLRVTPALSGAHHGIFVPADRVESVRIGNHELREDARPSRSPIWVLRHQTTGPEGLDLVLKLRGSEPLELWVYERRYGLPGSAEALVRARPRWTAPLREPDRTIAVRSVHVDPVEAPRTSAADSNGI